MGQANKRGNFEQRKLLAQYKILYESFTNQKFIQHQPSPKHIKLAQQLQHYYDYYMKFLK